MAVVNLQDIKRHLNIDYDDDDYLLQQQADAAEDALLTYLQRSLKSLTDANGNVRPAFKQAVLLLTGNFHDSTRSGVAFSSSNEVAYTLSFLLLPLKKFCSSRDTEETLEELIEQAYDSIKNANSAAEKANDAAIAAKTASEKAEMAASSAIQASTNAALASMTANTAADNATKSSNSAVEAARQANEAAKKANDARKMQEESLVRQRNTRL